MSNRKTPLQDAQKGCPARPQPPNAPEAYLSHPPTPELPRQLVTRVGYVEDLVEPRTTLGARFNILLMGDFLSAQINLSHAFVALHLLDGTFANDGALVQDRHDAGDLPNELHIVFDDNDCVLFR